MGVTTGKSFTFDGETSASYSVYITGEGVFNAPERAVEMISIPGRDGAYVLDNGHFENVEITYHCGMYDSTEANFATKMAAFRNWICSKVGYKRLTDEYNTGEYRMAVYKSGLEVDHEGLLTGEFDITFECKPQRFLTSGETATSVANNGTINNPTLYASRPTLTFQGYGEITLAGQKITVKDLQIGNVMLANSKTVDIDYPSSSAHSTLEVVRHTIDGNILNSGNTFVLDSSTFTYTYTEPPAYVVSSEMEISNQTGTGVSTEGISQDTKTAASITTFDPITFTRGTSKTVTHTFRSEAKFLEKNGSYDSWTSTKTVQISYDGNSTIIMSATEEADDYPMFVYGSAFLGQAIGYSTKTASGTKTIDLEIGEAYWLNSNVPTSLDYAVTLPVKLPTLAPGNNTITYQNTITNFKVTPNWWKV